MNVEFISEYHNQIIAALLAIIFTFYYVANRKIMELLNYRDKFAEEQEFLAIVIDMEAADAEIVEYINSNNAVRHTLEYKKEKYNLYKKYYKLYTRKIQHPYTKTGMVASGSMTNSTNRRHEFIEYFCFTDTTSEIDAFSCR